VIAYLDTSALVKLYVAEHDSAEVRASVVRVDRVAISRAAYPEARSALARRQREGCITPSGLRTAVSALDQDMPAFLVVELSESVARLGGELAERHALGGIDAIHLASAVELGHLVGSPPVFLSLDARQSRAAVAEGLLHFRGEG
jgi:predicted nucleic acid-binding protein